MADTVKTVGYSLYENYLRKNEDEATYFARVNSRRRITRNDLVEMIAKRNTTVTKQEISSVLDHLEELVMDNLKMGFTVQTGLFTVSVGVRGSFESMDDEFDPDRHRTVINVRNSPALKKLSEKELAVVKQSTNLPNPSVFNLFDYDSGTTNSRLPPGNVAALTGNCLKIDRSDETQGIFFTPEEGAESVKAEKIIFSTNRKLVFKIPAELPPGSYTVSVRCGFGTDLRTSSMKSTVTTAEEVSA